MSGARHVMHRSEHLYFPSTNYIRLHKVHASSEKTLWLAMLSSREMCLDNETKKNLNAQANVCFSTSLKHRPTSMCYYIADNKKEATKV